MDDLFGDKYAFQTMASKDNVLVQVADFFWLSAQIYKEKAPEEAVLAYKKILHSLTLGMLEWPSKYQYLLPPPTNELDMLIIRYTRTLSARHTVSASGLVSTLMKMSACS